MLLEYPEYGCEHEFPDDWILGGACGGDVRADPRWMPSTYEYLDRSLRRITMSSEPICDHQATGEFRDRIEARYNCRARYVMVTRPNGTPEMLLAETEEVT